MELSVFMSTSRKECQCPSKFESAWADFKLSTRLPVSSTTNSRNDKLRVVLVCFTTGTSYSVCLSRPTTAQPQPHRSAGADQNMSSDRDGLSISPTQFEPSFDFVQYT